MHDRRHFLTGLGVLFVSPLVAEAQPAGKVPRVGFLLGRSPGPSPEVDAFQRGLRELGYIEGRNIAIDYRYAHGQVERLPELATELVRLNPDETARCERIRAAHNTNVMVYPVPQPQ